MNIAVLSAPSLKLTEFGRVAVGGAIAGIAGMGLVQGLLALVGFGPGGIIAGMCLSVEMGLDGSFVSIRGQGSIAAGIQSAIGNVAAGSFFALIQGFAMGGIGIAAWLGAAVTGILAAVGLAV